ncbi:MAG: conjugative transposon protein TraM (plasmid) [Candidatus Cardinium sp.]|uniref:conjugative transposon protein TraM n=1 Tax=Cardinium endosymbiont of Dermatophagoides farinae TaxID=2597823 RepID=UPI00118319C0|nr:conjugative transposon protein TraM [Cardinium endosymbiont of Dermatophagoides farinae]TSJ80143.1 conjugative transposon protein TraM [Cardinium endosymbiont of Dermatophagoides farinae]TSJ80204.1 conjugative transposon protein TraM [Cardinium endosymbiont of Dermatophagoides farinae]UWW97610.1 MAG: conjugative transposon protein TraM [Candidatus Cardinium sp.]
MDKKKLGFGLAGLLVISWIILRDVRKTKSWHEFFVAPPPKPCKLLEKAEPLSVTKETNQRMKGRYQSEQVGCSLFEDMAKNINQEVSKGEPEPVKEPEKVSVKLKKVVQKLKKIVHPQKQEKNYFPVSFERKGRKKNIKVKNSFSVGYVYGTQELKHGRSIKICVKEAFTYKGQEIHKGAFLYGIVAFGKERILSKLEIAEFGKNVVPVAIGLYDSDYMIGLLVENLHPFIDQAQNKLLSKAASSGSNSWIREISGIVVDGIKSVKNEQKITIDNRRKVFLKPIEK